MPDALDDRLRAVERALDDSPGRAASSMATDDDPTEPRRETASTRHAGPDSLSELESRLDDTEETVAELEAAVQALRGYAGKVRSVDERVEERADAALAAVESLESRLEAIEDRPTADRPTDSRENRPRTDRGAARHEQVTDGVDTGGDRCTCDCHASLREGEWPTSPAPRFAPGDEPDADPGLLARLRDRL